MILLDEFIGGAVGNWIDGVGGSIKDGILSGFKAVFEYLFNIISVIVFWGCKIGIIVCLLIFFCSHDQKSITLAIKLGFVYLIMAIIGGVI